MASHYSVSCARRTVIASPTTSNTAAGTAIAHHIADDSPANRKNGKANKRMHQLMQTPKKYLSRRRINLISQFGQQRGAWRLIMKVCKALKRCPHSGQHLASR